MGSPWGLHGFSMGAAWGAWSDLPMKWDGIDMGQKIPLYPSRAEWGDKTKKTVRDEKGLFCAAAVVHERRFFVVNVVFAVLTLEDITYDLLLLLQVMQLVCCLCASCLDEVRAKPQRVACLT